MNVTARSYSTPTHLYPLTFDPVFKDYPWGGRNLERFGRRLPDGIVAESWDIAGHPNGSSTVNAGPLAGKTLPEVLAELGQALVGERCDAALKAGKFPVLIKLLDANAWLSVQVHPDDAYALAHEGEWGKTEMWVVLHAEPGAELIYGFEPGVTRDRYAQEIAAGRAGDSLHRLAVEKGDVVFLRAGSIHALGPGIVVAEVQQNSDATYRIYDWGRPRPIHIEQSLDVLDFGLVEPGPIAPVVMLDDDGMKVELLATCDYFQTERLTLPVGGQFFGLCDGESFEVFGVIAGRVVIEWEGAPVELSAVNWVLIPADLGEFQVVADEESVLLRVFVP
jgi:mannose-6-phosphate isomerase